MARSSNFSIQTIWKFFDKFVSDVSLVDSRDASEKNFLRTHSHVISTFAMDSQHPIFSKFTAAQLQALSPEQIAAFSGIPLTTVSSTTTYPNPALTDLPDSQKLKGKSNWLDFKVSFRSMLMAIEGWERDASNNAFGNPKASVGLHILRKNVIHQSSLDRIAVSDNAAAAG
jgi:hypothetical protein